MQRARGGAVGVPSPSTAPTPLLLLLFLEQHTALTGRETQPPPHPHPQHPPLHPQKGSKSLLKANPTLELQVWEGGGGLGGAQPGTGHHLCPLFLTELGCSERNLSPQAVCGEGFGTEQSGPGPPSGAAVVGGRAEAPPRGCRVLSCPHRAERALECPQGLEQSSATRCRRWKANSNMVAARLWWIRYLGRRPWGQGTGTRGCEG